MEGFAMLCGGVFRSLEGFGYRVVEKRGRLHEEIAVEIYIGYRGVWRRLLVVKIFNGRPPFYRRWIEVFAVAPRIEIADRVYVFLGSEQEKNLIDCLSALIGPGERLFIEYVYDRETWKALEIGIPPHLTRIGYMLLENGFTWFKDWYFPEGFMEGSPKIQAEKPLDNATRVRHVEEICVETKRYLGLVEGFVSHGLYPDIVAGVKLRAEKILSDLCRGV